MSPKAKIFHLQMDNMVALRYVVKTGGTHNQILSGLVKELWDYFLLNGITITVFTSTFLQH